jgi:hypothetical protein
MNGADEKLDALILAELARDAGTLLELSIRTGKPTSVLLPRLQVLGSLKRVQCVRDEDDGRLLWELTDEASSEIDPAVLDEPNLPAPPVHVEHSPAPAPAPTARPAVQQVAPGTTLTDRIVQFVADRGLATAAQVIAAFPGANNSSVYSLLSQLVTAKRLVRVKLPGRAVTEYRVFDPADVPPQVAPTPAAPAAPAPADPDPLPPARGGGGMVLTMQDADYASLLKIGTVVISNDPKAGVQITVAGFQFGADGSCRENAARALHWARALIETALSAQLLVPGGSSRIVVGMD